MRRRTDDNHTAIMAAFRALGFAVFDASAAGKGFPDLVVYRPLNGVVLVEIKDGSKPPSRRRKTAPQIEFAKHFPVSVVYRVEDVAALANSSVFDIPRIDLA